MSGKLGLAILGSGIFVAEAHLPAVLGLESVIELKGLWSRSQKSVETLASADALKKAGIKVDTYHGDAGLQEVLGRSDIQGVIMALPISKQPEVIEKCFKAGKHVLSEKPIGKDLAQAKALIKTYESTYKSKGIQWRVAENFAHEPGVLAAAEILRNPAIGPVLHYDARVSIFVRSGHKYHATEWRNIPDYQGGFLLDGGVHFAAAIRCILGEQRPTQVISLKSLHRTHLGPHDSIHAIVSAPTRAVDPHGEDFPQPSNMPQGLGKSVPSGTVSFSFAQPELPAGLPGTWTFTCLNAVVTVKMGWSIEISSSNEEIKKLLPGGKKEFKSNGVPGEVEQWAKAILGKEDEKVNRGEPIDALWDLAFIESCLESDGKPIDLAKAASL